MINRLVSYDHKAVIQWLFMELISWNTRRGGHGTACEECTKIGKVLKCDNYD